MNRHLSSCGVLALVLAGCGGSSDGVAVGLSTPDQLSVVEPVQNAPFGSGGSGVAPAGSVPDLPPGSDYHADETRVNVYDPALEPLQTINTILCALGLLGTTELVNQPPYLAQVDFEACENGSGGGPSDPSSSDRVDSFEIWTVESRRANNDSPQVVHLWIPNTEQSYQDTSLFVEGEITQGVSAQNPFGRFRFDFAGINPGETLANPTTSGSLQTAIDTPNMVGFRYFESLGDVTATPPPNDHAGRVRVNVLMADDLATGTARVVADRRTNFGMDSGLITQEFLVAFDETHFLRDTDGDGGVVYHRDQFRENVWRYGLYDATTGERVEVASGFGIKNVADEYGYVGYYGLWAPDGADFAHGAQVERETFGNAAPEAYTVFRAPGRLIRYQQRELDLAQAGGYLFEWPSSDPMTGDPVLYAVEYVTMTASWERVGTIDFATREVTPLVPPEVIDTAAEGYLGMWSSELGGQASYVHGDTFLSYYERSFVDGSDEFFGSSTELQLFGLVSCLDSAISAADAENGDVFLPDATSVSAPYHFTFERADLTLRYDADGPGGSGPLTVVGLDAGVEVTAGPYTWGMQSGPLVASTAGIVNPWDVWNADEFFVYETGHNEWNRYVGLTDVQGDFVSFEPPLRFSYTHATANDRNEDATYDGRTYLIEYGGFGNLWGLPQEEVDLNGDMNPDRFYPVINLNDGVLVGPTGVEYVVKAIEVEQTLLEDPAYAGSLSLTGVDQIPLPSFADYEPPTNDVVPVVTDPPRVIDGVIVQ